MAPDAPTQTRPRLGTDCPNCGAHADPGQLVCLECGSRLALDYRRPRGWLPAAAIIGLVLLVAGAAFVITLVAVDDDSKDEVAAAKAGKEAGAVPKSPAKRAPKRETSQPTRTGGVPNWPADRNGYTVVLLSTGDAASARDFARNARRGGVDAGVLHSDNFSSLEKGFWIVFWGIYKNRSQAERRVARLGGSFSGAYPQFVDGAKKR